MRHFDLTLLSLATLAGCSQILGVDDYQIDRSLDGRSGNASSGGSRSEGGKTNEGGDPGTGAFPSGGSSPGGSSPGGSSPGGSSPGGSSPGGSSQGGSSQDGGSPQGGEPQVGQAGEPPVGQAGAGGEGGAPAQVIIPCDSVVCCSNEGGEPDAGVELLQDGGFELGTVADGLTPWTELSVQEAPLITDGSAEDATPNKGTYFAFLGGLEDEISIIDSETFTVPSDAGWLVFSAYRYFQLDSAIDDELNQDLLAISLYDPATEDLVDGLSYWDNTDPGQTNTWTRFEVRVSAAEHQGQPRYLSALGSTDAYVTDGDLVSSNYMLDDLSLKAFRCLK